MRIPSELLASMTAFRNKLRDGNYCVEHDVDVDGFASGIITTVALRKKGFDAQPYAVERSKTFVPDSASIIFTDLAVNNEVALCIDSAVQNGISVYAIDHHPWMEGYCKRFEAQVNPHCISGFPKPSSWNAGFLAYLTFRDLVQDWEWLAAVSIYTDMCVAPWNEHILHRFGPDKVKEAGDLLTAFIAVGGLRELGKIILEELRSVDDVLRERRFAEARAVFDSAVDKYVEEPKDYAILWDENKKIAVIETEEQYVGLKSVVSTRISLKPTFRDWVIAVIGRRPEEGYFKVSLRCQDWENGANVGELARRLADKIGGSGGGHPPAAGMRIPEDKKEAFVDSIHSSLF